MTRKKNSLLKPAMIITLIVALNLLGISYGQWQDSLMSILQAHTGYIELSFGDDPIITPDEFSAKLVKGEGSKAIEVDGIIERDGEGSDVREVVLTYTIENNGSLPVTFNGIQIEDSGSNRFAIIEGPNGSDIGPKDSANNSVTESITIQIDVSAADDTQRNDTESYSLGQDTPDVYEFKIELLYKIGSWTDKLTINGSVEVVQPLSLTAMPIPMISPTVQGGIDTGGLPESPSDEELYGEGGTREEFDEPETVGGGNEQASEGNDGGESPGDEELYNTGGTTEEADEPEAIEDYNEPESDSKDEEEGSNEESEEDDGEEESGNQEQSGGEEATEEADEPEEAEDNSEPVSTGNGEGESSDDQVQVDAGEGN